MSRKIGKFSLENEDKIYRVIHGSMGRGGVEVGGLLSEFLEEEKIPQELLLAHYDRLGGFITLDGAKVETGSFWDIKAKKPRAKAEVVRLFRDLRGRVVKLKEGEEKPVEVVAAEKLAIEDR